MAKQMSNGSAGDEGQRLRVATRGQFIRDMSFENFKAQRKEWQPVEFEVDYCGLFTIENMPEGQLQPYLAVQCPHLLYPFLRRIISDVTRDGGFPPYNMELIDFAAIYQRNLVRLRTAGDSG